MSEPLERFAPKWKPVRRNKTRPSSKRESVADSKKRQQTLVVTSFETLPVLVIDGDRADLEVIKVVGALGALKAPEIDAAMAVPPQA